ncbi:MFS transporter [Actinophytocola algeriensis]|uniref:Putative MFS family arabinose efflux permease n=1 Tax=Actinophytocola algeriensis TaxID=1768010 RepID=A0A7W7VD06_9PSEU|nr:MFS transporter [Actinophytocola algeriensis]MBB4905637.1 putative MFS family arabinose efflux permease [Actinophytocola algeriensis]MBE1472678.1 putative MFS family arabinose efflux permease [Actinophytocola algeriensis]
MGLPIRALAALTTAAFVTVLTEALPAGVLPAMSADLRVGQSAMGQAVTIYAIGTALAAIPLSSATAGWRRKRLLLFGVAGFAIANTVTAVSGDYVLTMAARFVAGIAAGVVWALLAGYAARLAPEPLRGKAIAVVMAGIPLALSLGVPAGTFLGDLLGWRVTFWVMTAVAVVLLGWIVALVPDFPGSRGGRPDLRATLRVPGVPAILFVTLVFVLAHTVLYTYVATFLGARGMGGAVDVVLLVFGVASMVSIVVVGAHVDRRLRTLTVVSAALFAVAVAVLAGSTAFVFVAAAVWGLGWGGVPTLLQTAAAKAGGAAADTAQAMLVTLWNAAMAAGGVAGGLLLDHGGPGALPWTALVLMPPVLAVVLAARRHGFPSARAHDQRHAEGDHRGGHQAVQHTP